MDANVGRHRYLVARRSKTVFLSGGDIGKSDMHTETTDKQRMSRITSIEARGINDGLDSMGG